MKIEKLSNKNLSKGILIGIIIAILIFVIINLLTSRAKYRNTQSINIAKGKVSYSAADLDIVEMYKIENGQEIPIDEVPGDGYILNNKTNCKVKDVVDESIKIEYVDGKLNISDMSKKGTKCYIYFEKLPTAEDTLAKLNLKTNGEKTTFYGIADTDEGIYSAPDGMYGGTSYYWRGAVENNYVHFANKYWRIIRINGDGTIRLIYDGTTKHDNGEGSDNRQIGEKAFNSSYYDDNRFVGFKYEDKNVHGTTTASTILGTTTDTSTLYGWYKTNMVDKNLDSKIDQNGLFCNDRNATVTESQTWDDWLAKKKEAEASGKTGDSGGISSTVTYYGAYMRFVDKNSVTPTLSCENPSDIFSKTGSSKGNKSLTYPVGLITADEVIFAGGWYGTENSSYYLYTGEEYWTMSPDYFDSSYGGARVFLVYINGFFSSNGSERRIGVRPVINLRSDIEFKTDTDGTINNPYEVI